MNNDTSSGNSTGEENSTLGENNTNSNATNESRNEDNSTIDAEVTDETAYQVKNIIHLIELTVDESSSNPSFTELLQLDFDDFNITDFDVSNRLFAGLCKNCDNGMGELMVYSLDIENKTKTKIAEV